MFVSILVLAVGSTLVLFSRRLLGRWFNHLSLYSVVWSMSLAAHEVGLVSYYPIDAITWGVIAGAALSFFLGSMAVILVERRRVNRGGRVVHASTVKAKVSNSLEAFPGQRREWWAILGLSFIGLLGVAQGMLILTGFWGGLDRVLRFATDVYLTRVANPIEGQVPYLSVAAVAACSLAGLYASQRGFSIICIIPFIVLFSDAVNAMGAATYLLGGILFLCSYLLPERKHGLRATLLLLLVGVSLPGMLRFIRGTRGAPETYGYESQTLISLSDAVGLSPAMYNHVSVAPGVLNEFLRRPYRTEIPGSQTLGTVFRVLGRFKLTEPTPRYAQVFYTPVPANVGTYLLPLYADFGISGILLGPFILGILCTWLWFRFKTKPTLRQAILISHVYALVTVSPIVNCLGDWGSWGVSLSFGLLMAWAVEARGRVGLMQSRAAATTPRMRGAGASSRSLVALSGLVRSKGKTPGS